MNISFARKHNLLEVNISFFRLLEIHSRTVTNFRSFVALINELQGHHCHEERHYCDQNMMTSSKEGDLSCLNTS